MGNNRSAAGCCAPISSRKVKPSTTLLTAFPHTTGSTWADTEVCIGGSQRYCTLAFALQMVAAEAIDDDDADGDDSDDGDDGNDDGCG